MNHDDLDRGEVICRQCGAYNEADADYCVSCGARLGDSRSTETVIDISTDRPRIVTPDDDVTHEGPFGRVRTIRFDQGRVVVARGGSTACLIILAVVILTLGCVCWAIWTTVGSVF